MEHSVNDIVEAHRKIREIPTTEERLAYMLNHGFELCDLDNYSCEPGADRQFEEGYHRWLFYFHMTTGVERAAVIQLAAELFKATANPHLYGAPFFSSAFTDSTRDMYYAKAMCMLYRDLT